MPKSEWPAWFNGPKGETEIFESADDVPNGWTSGAEKRTVKQSKAPENPDEPKPAKAEKPAKPAKAEKPAKPALDL